MLVIVAASIGAQVSQEYAVKAEVLYNFLLFVEWPDSAFPTQGTPIRICVAGDDPFGAALDTAMAGRQVKGRAITVARTVNLDAVGCHLLFVSRSQTEHIAQILQSLKGSVLTVGDTGESVRRGAMIGLFNDRNRLRFEINPAAATATGIRISSRLLNLARLAPANSSGG